MTILLLVGDGWTTNYQYVVNYNSHTFRL